ncbi:hypothetical protein [Deinococcus sp. S9]|nr:hypothetical protein [Deinococcus sp. S9]
MSAILWAFHTWWPAVPAPWHPWVPFFFFASLILWFLLPGRD